jgi:GntR family transcriptional regulator
VTNLCSQDNGEGTAVSPRSRADSAGAVPERRDVYERLADELRQGILSGRYKPGDRLPSTMELMERTGVANLTVRGAYRVLVEEGLVESISKKGFYVRRPNAMTWRMNPPKGSRRVSPDILDRWAADADEAGLEHREEISVAIEDGSVAVLGKTVGERLGLAGGSRVLVRRAVRRTRPSADDAPGDTADSLADEYYPYDLVRDSPLASPAPASPVEVLAGLGRRLRGHVDEIRPRLATTEERRVLNLPQVSVVLELARTAHDGDGAPVAVLHQIRRGDGATFQYEVAYTGK